MSKKVSVGVEIKGDAKSYKAATEDAKRASAQLSKEARARSKEIEQSFKNVTMAVAKIGAAVLVAKKAFEVYTKIMKSTEGSSDNLRVITDHVTGAMSGLFRTMVTGNWESLIGNIKRATEATRDFGKAMDALEDIIIGDSITLGQWERKLQAARLEAAEFKDTDPARAKKATEEAIFYQKAITSLTVKQLNERAQIDEQYYSKLSNQSKAYFDYLITQLPLIAQNQRMLLDPVYMEGLKKQIAGLEYLKQLGSAAFTKAKEAELHVAKMALYTIQDFIMLRDEMSKPGQFNAYIEGLGKIQAAMAMGDQELVRLTKQLAVFKKEAAEKITTPSIISDIRPAAFMAGPDTGLEEFAKQTDKFLSNIELEKTAVEKLASAFDLLGYSISGVEGEWISYISNVASGVAGAITAIAALTVAQKAYAAACREAAIAGGAAAVAAIPIVGPVLAIAAIASIVAAFAALTNIPKMAQGGIAYGPTLANVGEYAGAKSDPEVIAPLSKLKGLIGGQTILVKVKGEISGRTIYLAGERYAEVINAAT